jgi:RadC-like JAB domain
MGFMKAHDIDLRGEALYGKGHDDRGLARAFVWLTKNGMGRHFPGMPIGWYQQHQIAALYVIRDAAAEKGASLEKVRVRHGMVQAIKSSDGLHRVRAKWVDLISTRQVFELADKKTRGGEGQENPVAADYIAVDARGKKVGGPYKNYDEARREADRAKGYVQYAFEGHYQAREAGRAWQIYYIVDTKTGACVEGPIHPVDEADRILKEKYKDARRYQVINSRFLTEYCFAPHRKGAVPQGPERKDPSFWRATAGEDFDRFEDALEKAMAWGATKIQSRDPSVHQPFNREARSFDVYKDVSGSAGAQWESRHLFEKDGNWHLGHDRSVGRLHTHAVDIATLVKRKAGEEASGIRRKTPGAQPGGPFGEAKIDEAKHAITRALEHVDEVLQTSHFKDFAMEAKEKLLYVRDKRLGTKGPHLPRTIANAAMDLTEARNEMTRYLSFVEGDKETLVSAKRAIDEIEYAHAALQDYQRGRPLRYTPHDNPHEGRGGGSTDYGDILVGMRVTIVDRFGKEHTGRAVMLGPAGWVLNMGGRSGTPAVATLTNFVRVSGRGRTDRRFDARENPLTMIRGEGRRPKLDTFTEAYFEAALWTSSDILPNEEGQPEEQNFLDANYSIADFAPVTRDAMLADAERFQGEHYEEISEDLPRAGHDFWLTRNGHGAGFWDGDWPEDVGERLTEAAKTYGPFELYVGDDGKIYAVGHERPAHLKRVKEAGEPVPVVYERGVGQPLAAGEDKGEIEIEPIEQGGCIPWVKVTRDPDKYESCLARAKKIGPVDTPEKVFELLETTYEQEDQEVFLVVLTDIRGQLRGVAEVARGQRSRVSVDTVDILRVVVTSGAEGFTVAHNHPSGSPKPSKADKDLTRAITRATESLNGGKGMSGVAFLDHVVCGVKKYHSLREHEPELFR